MAVACHALSRLAAQHGAVEDVGGDELPALLIVVLHQRDAPRERAPVAVEQALGEGLIGATHKRPAMMAGAPVAHCSRRRRACQGDDLVGPQ